MRIGPCDYEGWRRRVARLLRESGGSPVEAGFAGGAVWSPPTDVFETEDAVVVKMELPGVRREEVSIVLIDDRLVVRGRREERETTRKIRYQQMEIAYGPFVKVLLLDTGYDRNRIEVTMSDGYLSMRIPRAPRKANEKIALEIRL